MPDASDAKVGAREPEIAGFYGWRRSDPPSLCACCGKPILAEAEQASDGELVHQGCEDAYEDNIYFREFNDDDK